MLKRAFVTVLLLVVFLTGTSVFASAQKPELQNGEVIKIEIKEGVTTFTTADGQKITRPAPYGAPDHAFDSSTLKMASKAGLYSIWCEGWGGSQVGPGEEGDVSSWNDVKCYGPSDTAWSTNADPLMGTATSGRGATFLTQFKELGWGDYGKKAVITATRGSNSYKMTFNVNPSMFQQGVTTNGYDSPFEDEVFKAGGSFQVQVQPYGDIMYFDTYARGNYLTTGGHEMTTAVARLGFGEILTAQIPCAATEGYLETFTKVPEVRGTCSLTQWENVDFIDCNNSYWFSIGAYGTWEIETPGLCTDCYLPMIGH